MDRHALAFRVRPGLEGRVAALLGGYDPPALDVGDGTRLLATGVFMQGNLVLRAIEIEGDLGKVSRHIASDPNVRRVEGELAGYLEEPYDPADPVARQGFFRTRLLQRLAHLTAGEVPAGTVSRIALQYAPGHVPARELAQELAVRAQDLLLLGQGRVHDVTFFARGADSLLQVSAVSGDPAPVLTDLVARLSGRDGHSGMALTVTPFRKVLERVSRGPDVLPPAAAGAAAALSTGGGR